MRLQKPSRKAAVFIAISAVVVGGGALTGISMADRQDNNPPLKAPERLRVATIDGEEVTVASEYFIGDAVWSEIPQVGKGVELQGAPAFKQDGQFVGWWVESIGFVQSTDLDSPVSLSQALDRVASSTTPTTILDSELPSDGS